jgi:hypothetical protein
VRSSQPGEADVAQQIPECHDGPHSERPLELLGAPADEPPNHTTMTNTRGYR